MNYWKFIILLRSLMKNVFYVFLLLNLMFIQISFAQDAKRQISVGKKLYESRCVICHGVDAKGTGSLAHKSNPPTPDLTSCEYQKKLAQCPGRMVASIVLTPGGNLIPKTLKENNIILPNHVWTDTELRAINEYLLMLIEKQPRCVNNTLFRMHITDK